MQASADKANHSLSASGSFLIDSGPLLRVLRLDRVEQRLDRNENGGTLLPRTVALPDEALEVEPPFVSDEGSDGSPWFTRASH
ncbi:hypothetical protein [uncultured Azohydromonas sp.]|jgi:hypothetical protein|uniref:hypothetical protein n=1 Tax=uncultured Azohydromonas sp. TaxID=487342 RepID=UPI0026329D0D|nr:hypothetical protein [uncultured Azohydromonas sp.]